ncbi:hypothetical protein BKA70DRAFT_1281508, partial [Coprinopsis sp. MPI-PUGE-AT-0042]
MLAISSTQLRALRTLANAIRWLSFVFSLLTGRSTHAFTKLWYRCITIAVLHGGKNIRSVSRRKVPQDRYNPKSG